MDLLTRRAVAQAPYLTKRVVTIAVHTMKDVGAGLLNRMLKDAGIKESKH